MTHNRPADPSVSFVRHDSGFTMIEIMIAMAMTAMIGLAVSSMLVSVSYGTTTQDDLRRTTVKEKVIATRMDQAIRLSKMVLAQGPDHLVLWMGDRRRNGVPDLSEIRRIDRDNTTMELWSYSAPMSLSDSQNTPYSFATDFDATTSALMGTSNFPGELWGTGVTSWNQTLDQSNPQSAKLVGYSLTLPGNNVPSAATGVLSLRSR